MSHQSFFNTSPSPDLHSVDRPQANQTLGLMFYLLLTAFVTILTLLWIGRPEIVTRGEGREALVARSLYEQHEFVLPKGYGGVVPSKPPALHWLIGICSGIFGQVSEFTCRLPSALASLFFILFFASWLARRDLQRVWPTVIVLATSFEWLRASVSCRVDMLHAASLAGAAIIGSGIYPLIRSTRLRWLTVVTLCLISTLTKGPVGALLPAAIIFLFGYWEHRRPLLSLISAGSIALGAINLAAIWYLAAYFQGGSEFIDKVSYENLQRFMSTMDDSPHRHSVWYLVGMGILGFMPWSLPFIAQFVGFIFGRGGVVKDVDERQPISCQKKANPLSLSFGSWLRNKGDFIRTEALKCWSRIITEPESRLSIVAILVLFTFYAIPSGKRGVYLLAAYPFGAILIGRVICESHKVRFRVLAAMTKIVKLLVPGLALSLIGLGLAVKYNLYPLLNPILAVEALLSEPTSAQEARFNLLGIFSKIQLLDFGLSIFVLIVLSLGLKSLGERASDDCHGLHTFKKLALAYGCLLVLVQAVLFPLATNSLGVRDIAMQIDEISDLSTNQGSKMPDSDRLPIYSYGSELYSVAFYSNNHFTSATPLFESVDFRGFEEGTWVALESRYLKRFEDRLSELKTLQKGERSAGHPGCLDIAEIVDFRDQEKLIKGRMALVKITCKTLEHLKG